MIRFPGNAGNKLKKLSVLLLKPVVEAFGDPLHVKSGPGAAGDIEQGEAMGILQSASLSSPQGGTIWLAVYDLKARGVYVCLNGVYVNPQYLALQHTGDP